MKLIGRILVLYTLFVMSSCNRYDKHIQASGLSIDSLIEHATNMHEAGDIQGAIHYLDSAVGSVSYFTTRDKYQYYYYLYDIHFRTGNAAQEQLYTDSLIWLIEETHSQDVLTNEYAKACFARADKLLRENKYSEAYQYYYYGKSVAEKGKDSCVLSYYIYKIGNALYKGEQYAKAASYFKESMNMFSKCIGKGFSSFYRMQEIADNIGLCYYKNNMPDSALYYYQYTLNLNKQYRHKYPASKARMFDMADAVVYGNMGSAYAAVGNYTKAEEVFKSSIAINSQKWFDNKDAQFTRIKLADLYIRTGRKSEAKKVLDEVAAIQDTMADIDVSVRWNNTMQQYWMAEHRKDLAYDYLLAYRHLTDSIESAGKKLLVTDMDTKVANLENQKKIDLLQAKDESKKRFLIISSFAWVLAIIVILLIYNNWRNSRKHVKLLQQLNDDISEQKSKLQLAHDELSKAGKEKDRILKAVSHDMRSPVHSALALTELILNDKKSLTQEQVDYLDLIKDSCTVALSLTKDLLEVATMLTENMTKEDADIAALTKSTIDLLRFKASEKGQDINLTVPGMSLMLFVNKEKIARVINNLVNNAIKFSPSGAVINVKLDIDSEGAKISVADNGIGIPDDIKDKIFDLFTEAKRLGTSGEQPYGLGLSISKQIIEAHNGKIWFESKSGHGTTFFVHLPVR